MYSTKYSGQRFEKIFCWDKDDIISTVGIIIFDVLGLLVCWWL